MVFVSYAGQNFEVPRGQFSAWYTFLFVYLSHVDNCFPSSLPILIGIFCLLVDVFTLSLDLDPYGQLVFFPPTSFSEELSSGLQTSSC